LPTMRSEARLCARHDELQDRRRRQRRNEKRRCRCQERAGMDNRLTERTIPRAIVDGHFSLPVRKGDLDDAVRALGVEVRLRHEGLQHESKCGEEHEKTGHRTPAPSSPISCCGSGHEPTIDGRLQSYATSVTKPQPGKPAGEARRPRQRFRRGIPGARSQTLVHPIGVRAPIFGPFRA
jgi:hypothetical protein